MTKFIKKAMLEKQKPFIPFKKGFDIREHVQRAQHGDSWVLEFIGSDDFTSVWYERQRYEVFAGLDMEPTLYEAIYDIVVDSTLPRNVSINKLGPAGVAFEEVKEGGEVKFVNITETSYSIPIKHYAVGLEYDKDLLMYNELWNIGIVERQAGMAYNAFLNHLHLSPFLTYSYTSANQTAASSTGSSLPEKYLRTLEDAITASKADTTNPRRGPYVMLASTANAFMFERMMTPVPQQGFTLQSSAMNEVSAIIAYDGWTGTRGKKAYSYSGVSANTAYLIDVGGAARYNFARSFVKQPLQSQLGESDMSRFILDQVIWDVYLGTYVSVPAIAEEVTLPTS